MPRMKCIRVAKNSQGFFYYPKRGKGKITMSKKITHYFAPKAIAPIQSHFGRIRVHPNDPHFVSAADICKQLTNVKNPRQSWISVKTRVSTDIFVKRARYNGVDTDFINCKGFAILVAHLRTNNKNAAELTRLRTTASQLALRYWNADPTLATDIIDRTNNVDDLEHIAARAESKRTQRLLTDAIEHAGGHGFVYSMVNNRNDVAITGMKASAIVAARAPLPLPTIGKKKQTKPQTRDLFRHDEHIALQFLEMLLRKVIETLPPHPTTSHIPSSFS